LQAVRLTNLRKSSFDRVCIDSLSPIYNKISKMIESFGQCDVYHDCGTEFLAYPHHMQNISTAFSSRSIS